MSSLSASAENLTNDSQSNDGSSMCLELALEGERLCKTGDSRAGIAFFQAAIRAGTDDLRTLSAIYSQLGNAYFYLGDYTKAMKYHNLDLNLAKSISDKLGEAKASGNLGNTLKVIGNFDEASKFCERHLTLARQLGDRLSEGRALYNLGNVYHAKGKHMGRDCGELPDEAKDVLLKAVEYYQQNLSLMKEFGDRGAQGRACGNLGNAFYMLGDFQSAIDHHHERLSIAREFGDKAAERRANNNLGNAHIFLGQYEVAAEHYKRTLSLAVELGERAVEAQACYSLGNTYTLLKDYTTTIDYHLRHLAIAQELGDKIGEARSCWSLGNGYSSLGNHEKALHYAQLHYVLAKDLDDVDGQSTAKINIIDLRKVLGLPDLSFDSDSEIETQTKRSSDENNSSSGQSQSTAINNSTRQFRVRRQSMEQLDLIKLTPDGKRINANAISQDTEINENEHKSAKTKEDDFFDLLTRSQSKRMDDQRCSLKVLGGSVDLTSMKDNQRKPLAQQNLNNNPVVVGVATTQPAKEGSRHALIEMIADLQSERMDEQRAQLPGFVTRSNRQLNAVQNNSNPAPDDAFLDMLMRCQGSRIEEQRSELPRVSNNINVDLENGESTSRNAGRRGNSNIGATVPDEDFFSLIMRVQGGRMEDQRAAIPLPDNRPNVSSALNNDMPSSTSSKKK